MSLRVCSKNSRTPEHLPKEVLKALIKCENQEIVEISVLFLNVNNVTNVESEELPRTTQKVPNLPYLSNAES